MRIPEIALSVLFPLLVVVAFALGTDATSAEEFAISRALFIAAALVLVALALHWFYYADTTARVFVLLFVMIGCIGALWVGAYRWLDLKENTYAYVVLPEDLLKISKGPYPPFMAVRGPYPVLHVSMSIRSTNDPVINREVYEIGDLEPNHARQLRNVPPLPGPGIYEVRIFGRTGDFQEILNIIWKDGRAYQGFSTSRVSLQDGQPTFTPMPWP
jgi:hypothetical protein